MLTTSPVDVLHVWPHRNGRSYGVVPCVHKDTGEIVWLADAHKGDTMVKADCARRSGMSPEEARMEPLQKS